MTDNSIIDKMYLSKILLFRFPTTFTYYSTYNYGIYGKLEPKFDKIWLVKHLLYIFIIYFLEIYAIDDFGTNMHTFVNTTRFALYLPKSVWNISKGAFVDGSFDKDPITVVTTTKSSNSSNRISITSFNFFISSLIVFISFRF